MKNLLFLFIMGIAITLGAQDAPAYFMYNNTYITPKADKMAEFAEAMAHHNKTFHSEGPFATNVFRVTSGPNLGKFVNSSGPRTWADVDARENDPAHNADWRDNVLPLIAKIQDGGDWVVQPDQSYLPEGGPFSKFRVIYTDVADGENSRYARIMGKLAEVTKEKRPTQMRAMLNRRGFHDDGKDRVIALGLNNWADMDGNISEDYEAVHGEGSWDLFLDEVQIAINSSVEELWVHMAGMSGPE